MVLVAGPTYGVGPFGVVDETGADKWVVTPMTTKISGGVVTLTIPSGDFGYFMHPIEYGVATFTDFYTKIPGGWDGAAWPLNDIGTTDGPITINVTRSGITRQYYLYRTDFDGLGVVAYQVDYANR